MMREIQMDKLKPVATAVITQAIQRAKGGDIFEIAWLASRQAEKWLDFMGISQSAMLKKIGWMEWAAAVVEQPEIIRGRYNDNHVAVIQESLWYMEDLQNVW